LCRIFAAAEAPIIWDPVDVTPVRYPDGTMGIPKAVIESVNKHKVSILWTPISAAKVIGQICIKELWTNLYPKNCGQICIKELWTKIHPFTANKKNSTDNGNIFWALKINRIQ
jgi:hypothetical protein